MIDILPCPNCNSEAVIFLNSDSSYVICHHCKMRGPSNTVEYAIADWNRLPRPLFWTSSPPSLDGCYWYLPPDENPIVLEIEDSLIRDGRLLIHSSLLQGKWSSSPIPIPLDTK